MLTPWVGSCTSASPKWMRDLEEFKASSPAWSTNPLPVSCFQKAFEGCKASQEQKLPQKGTRLAIVFCLFVFHVKPFLIFILFKEGHTQDL